MIDEIIDAKMCQLHDPPVDTKPSTVKLYAQLHNVSAFKQDTKRLRKIVAEHVVNRRPEEQVKVVTYYRPYKISSIFSTRIRPVVPRRSGCVYKFLCPEPSCNEAMYYGYTNQRLGTRVKQHRYQSSSICKHFIDNHDKLPPKFDDFIKNFSIIFSSSDVLSLKIAEAILIKTDKPLINIKYNELYDFLKLF